MSTTTTRDLAHPAPAKVSQDQAAAGRCGANGTFNFWLFTGPFLIGLVIFVYVPIGWSI